MLGNRIDETLPLTVLWSRGGLSWRELVWRTSRESWQDEVFGQAARLAFYHFLALFPALLLLLFLLVKVSSSPHDFRETLVNSLRQFLPDPAFVLVSGMIQELNGKAHFGGAFISGILGSLWASVNGTWAIMSGLNTAYEVREQRAAWKLAALAISLTLALSSIGIISLTLLFYGAHIVGAVAPSVHLPSRTLILLIVFRWAVIIVLLLTAFAILYRFAPNLSDRQWQWSTPGAALALVLWIAASLLLRLYFGHWHSYEEIYGHLAPVCMLLMWLYLTSAAILIGGEMNSEIEKATRAKAKPEREPVQKDRSGS
jgi:membrane protein